MSSPSEISGTLDAAEHRRREWRFKEAWDLTRPYAEEGAGQARALLLQARLLYQQGEITAALEHVRRIPSTWEQKERLAQIIRTMNELLSAGKSDKDFPFATVAMGRLLAEQGHIADALIVYYRVFNGSGDVRALREMLGLRERIKTEEGIQNNLSAAELRAFDRWIGARTGEINPWQKNAKS
jgi:hypothetical protein